jgi:hypothetical protein
MPKARKIRFELGYRMLPVPSLRRQFPKLWERLRKEALDKYHRKCKCGYVPPKTSELEAHEVYSFPGGGVIRLEKIVLLCRKCHHMVHLDRSLDFERRRAFREAKQAGLSDRLAEQKAAAAVEVYREDMLAHYCKVNGVARQEAEDDWEKATPPEDVKPYALRDGKGVEREIKFSYGPYEEEVTRLIWRRQWRDMGPQDRWNYGNSFEDFCDANDDDLADCYEFVPDHEHPEATAMWRDTFG